ncbi:HlyD family secretion protein [Flavitalea antarctica]
MPSSSLPQVDLINHLSYKNANAIYWAIIIMVALVILLLPIISVDVSVKAPGIIRPESERTFIRSRIPGIIERLYRTEGQFVEKDSVILTLKDNITQTKLQSIEYELGQKTKFIEDLELLTGFGKTERISMLSLSTPLYQTQLGRYVFQIKDQAASINKVKKELRSDSLLLADKVISKNEYFNKDIESQKMLAAFEAFRDEQIGIWQQQLSQFKSEVSQLRARKKQALGEKECFEIRAPVSGIIMGLASKYVGGDVVAGESLCELSPETKLIAECMVPTKDAGFLRPNQPVHFQVEAFDHNYFGIIRGQVISIDNDYTILENIPVFRVRCKLNQQSMKLKNGYSGHLKKGLRLQARFIIARRTIAQLLFDKVEDWLNPVAF